MTNKASATLAAHRLAVGLLLIYDDLFTSHLKVAVSGCELCFSPSLQNVAAPKCGFCREVIQHVLNVVSLTALLGGVATHSHKPILPTFGRTKMGTEKAVSLPVGFQAICSLTDMNKSAGLAGHCRPHHLL